jgi:hypothetical protein
VYVYNTRTNTGKYIKTRGDIPPASAFSSSWKSGHGKLTVGGGLGGYNFYYQNIENRNYATLYELNIFTKKWKSFETSGDIPSARGEVSTLQDPDDFSIIYLFGGVSSLGDFAFQSHSELFRYNKYSRHFELLGMSNTSRYHAHIFKTSDDEIEISQGVGRITIEDNVELSSTERFNLNTGTWRTVVPETELPVQRRHGVSFQKKIDGHLYGCLYSGDINHANRTLCCGCLFATYTDTEIYCNAFTTFNNKGSWERIDRLVHGPAVKTKYPGFDIIGNKLYVFSGQDVSDEEGQIFEKNVRVLEF